MNHKEIEKKNFVLWYGMYATEKELEMARATNKDTLDRLLREYSDEIDRIDRTKRLYEKIVQLRGVHAQGFDMTLKIDSFPHYQMNEALEKV